MNFDVIDQYESFVENRFIKKDYKQIDVLKKIVKIWGEYKQKKFFYNKNKTQGIYLYGSVGVGKSFLLNLFYQNTKIGAKIHFNQLMNQIHSEINLNKSKKENLDNYVKKLSNKNKIVFIDELHIFNIVDALIIKKLFLLFSKYKIFILISSNFHPQDLYLEGPHRSDFIPFINFMLKNYQVIELENLIDYRRLTLNQSKTYFTPIIPETISEFKKLFEKFVDTTIVEEQKIKIRSREITIKNCSANVAMFTFKNLCEEYLAHEDYKIIALKFSLIFIENVPQFTDQFKDECRRFISLIDMMYEENCSTVILAEAPISSMCKIAKLQKEFQRTSSRLYEMTVIKAH